MAIAVDDTLPFVRRCLEMAGKLLATGGAFLWKFDSRKNKLGLTAEWVTAGRPSQKEQLREIAGDVLAESLGCLMNGDILNNTDVSAMPAGLEREMAEGLERRAVLVVPLFSRGDVFRVRRLNPVPVRYVAPAPSGFFFGMSVADAGSAFSFGVSGR